MNNEHDNLASLADLHLSVEEKEHMKGLLQAYMVSYSPRPAWASFVLRHGIATTFAAVLLLAGASTVLAHRSLPGDVFYPLKLSVNDWVEVAISGDADSKLDTELAQIERMLRDEERAAFQMFDGDFDAPESDDESEDDQEDVRREDDDADEEDDDQDDADEEESRDDDDDRGQRSSDEDKDDDDEWLEEIADELHSLKAEIENVASEDIPEE